MKYFARRLRTGPSSCPGPQSASSLRRSATSCTGSARLPVPLAELADPVVARAVLDSLKIKLDGTTAAAETVRRKRRTLVNALHYAVDLGEFPENPLYFRPLAEAQGVQRGGPAGRANPEQARSLLHAVSYVGGYRRARGRRLVGLFAGMYFGGFRPAEVVGLTEPDLTLPAVGWGSALLHRTRPSVGKQWTDSGRATTTAA